MRELTFSAMNRMSERQLLAKQRKCLPASEQYKMIDYELSIRKVELPKEWKLNN